MRLTALAVLTLVSVSFTAANAQGRGRGGGRGSAVTIAAGEECPAGMTEIRPRQCMPPEFPPPSIVDYRPKSTLVTPVNMKPKAKYPAIDYHGHAAGLLNTAEGVERLGNALDSIGVRVFVAADNMSGENLKRSLALVKASPKMQDRVRILAGINFRDVGPGWAEKAVAQLDADVAAGAVGVGEISKSLGLSIKKPDGSRLRIDDPALDPVWQEAAKLNIPVFIHTADPASFFKPIDYHNERWLELALFGDRRYPQDRFPSFEELMTERDNMVRRNPKTTFVIAHMSWYANDLGKLGQLMDEFPNIVTEMGAVLYDIGRQPRVAHDFFIKYQDRILFGKDSFQPIEYPYYWRVFETKDDYFDYYRDYHAFWKLYGIDLPDEVLKKIYYKNALKLTPSLPQAGFPR
jgi:predicted TIM-barrel fold metal-dependent hydrolase